MAKRRIVIIEDDDTFAGIYESNFAEAGFDVDVVSDGESGLTMLKKKAPALVVLDLMLPHRSGFEVLAAMLGDSGLKKVPVIVVTNLDQHAERERARELGAKAYFVKAHTTFSDVLAKAKELLG